jgi:UDP-N-acetylmuramyl pentapeptide phosphotransferase/UDP-N-acetylglucosamine-1-phosphate transferase
MISFAVAFIVSCVVTGVLVRLSRDRAMPWDDHQLSGAQKFHAAPVPRVGGIGVAAGLVALAIAVEWSHSGPSRQIWLLLLAGLPAFVAGLAEDLTKRVGVGPRLLATMVSGGLAFALLGAEIRRLDVGVLDALLAYTAAALLLTVVATGGLANAINIIDGYKGLTAVVSGVMLLSLAYVGWQVGDNLVVSIAFATAGALAGFFIWNWPRGLIFLGDGGAYFIGFVLATLVILLGHNHPEVSAWYALQLFIYPVFETLFSVWRKKFLRGISPGVPDGLHLHMLVFRRLVRWAVGRRDAASLTLRNSLTAPYLWVLSTLSVLPATLFWRNTSALQASVGVFCVLYVWLYLRLVRFRAPRWLVLNAPRGGLISRFRDRM